MRSGVREASTDSSDCLLMAASTRRRASTADRAGGRAKVALDLALQVPQTTLRSGERR
jgi:hypothetical protein